MLLDTLQVDVLRGNQGEIASLYQSLYGGIKKERERVAVSGVDSVGYLVDAHSIVQRFASAKHNIVAMTGNDAYHPLHGLLAYIFICVPGKHDIVSDGERILEIHNNHALLSQV